LKLYNKQN